MLYVPEAQGSLPPRAQALYVRRPRPSLGLAYKDLLVLHVESKACVAWVPALATRLIGRGWPKLRAVRATI